MLYVKSLRDLQKRLSDWIQGAGKPRFGIDDLTTIDKIIEKLDQFSKENDILRGMAAKNMPCHYCGVKHLAECPHGFPGCSLADDILCAEETEMRSLLNRCRSLEQNIMGIVKIDE